MTYDEQVRAIQPDTPVMFNAGPDGMLPHGKVLEPTRKSGADKTDLAVQRSGEAGSPGSQEIYPIFRAEWEVEDSHRVCLGDTAIVRIQMKNASELPEGTQLRWQPDLFEGAENVDLVEGDWGTWISVGGDPAVLELEVRGQGLGAAAMALSVDRRMPNGREFGSYYPDVIDITVELDPEVFERKCGHADVRATQLGGLAQAYLGGLTAHYVAACATVEQVLSIPDELDEAYNTLLDVANIAVSVGTAFSAGALASVGGRWVERGLRKIFGLPKGDWLMDGAKNLAKLGVKTLGGAIPEMSVGFADHEPFALEPAGFLSAGLANLGLEEAAVSGLILSWMHLAERAIGGAMPPEFFFDFDPEAAIDELLLIDGEIPSAEVPATMTAELERMLWMQFCRTGLSVRGGGGYPARWTISQAAIRHLAELSSGFGEDWESDWVPQALQNRFSDVQASEHDWDADGGG